MAKATSAPTVTTRTTSAATAGPGTGSVYPAAYGTAYPGGPVASAPAVASAAQSAPSAS